MDITMPQLGESVTEGTILRWYKSVGEPVEADEVLFEVATDKVDAEVPSPVAGVITAIHVPEGATVAVGAVLATVDGAVPTGTPASATPAANTPAPQLPSSGEPGAGSPSPGAVGPPPTTLSSSSAPTLPPSAPTGTGGPTPANASPLARRILRDAGIPVAGVAGTGRLGRVTRSDAERAAATARHATPAVPTPAPPPTPSPTPSSEAGTAGGAPASSLTPTATPTRTSGGDTVVPLNRIRRRTGSHMVASRATSPHALVAVEVRYDAVERARLAHREAFRAEEGISLTYLPFIARAAVDALRRFPAVNASVTTSTDVAGPATPEETPAGTGLVLHGDVNLGFAVDLGYEGLVAPVIHRADDLRLRALARRVGEAARRARAGELGPDDLAGGTFTLTNSGSYGTHLVIPIINQPQVAILSTDAVRRQPVVVHTDDGDEAIGIGSVGLLALSWDHRAFDGAYASAFLDEVRTILETRDWEAELR